MNFPKQKSTGFGALLFGGGHGTRMWWLGYAALCLLGQKWHLPPFLKLFQTPDYALLCWVMTGFYVIFYVKIQDLCWSAFSLPVMGNILCQKLEDFVCQ
jgi:hypothetical protein